MRRPAPSHPRRFAAGVAVAAALAAAISLFLLRGAARDLAEVREQRKEIASLLMLTDLVGRAGEAGDAVRQAVAAWQETAPPGSVARVLLFPRNLVASTLPADVGERAAPRSLTQPEKPLFDRGQRLRQAVAGNAEGAASRPEIELEWLRDGAVLLAAGPVIRDGQVVGMVQIEQPARGAPAPVSPWTPLGAAAAAIAIAFAGGRLLPNRRLPAAVLGLACAALAVGAVAWHARATLDGIRRANHAAVAEHVRALAARHAAVVASNALPSEPAARPGDWDANLGRRPLGFLAPDGAPDPARVDAAAAEAARSDRGFTLTLAAAALAALLLVGLGATSALGAGFWRHRAAYAYTLPAMLGMLVLVFFPFFYGITLSFTDSTIYTTNKPLDELWVGFKHYADILGDFRIAARAEDGSRVFNYLNFYWTLGFTVFWTVTNVVIGVTVGLALALVLNTKGLALRPIYRVLLILPWAMPNYITALIWKGMFHQQFGVVNHALALVGLQPISWFDTPATSYLTALATNGWLSFPFMMVVSLGALQSIPADIYEAARVDGATRWQQFKAITLPSLRPALVPAIILSVVWTFNMFNIIYLVTAGQPGGATEILVTQAYKFAFEKYQYGYAAAYSTIIFGILLVYGVFQNRVTRATEGI
jgi:arabinogalactan oligomer/maltooligosaccharide transport system permease protein